GSKATDNTDLRRLVLNFGICFWDLGFYWLGLWAEVPMAADVPAFRCTSAMLRCRCNPAAFGQEAYNWAEF
ncbi:MAG TPA: hypothetical protein V6C58_26850, partial [Allocoleopsis sp.]